MEYDDSLKLSTIHTDEGLIEITTSGTGNKYNYEYYLRDHLGNVRVVFNDSGKLLQRTEYYPFGLKAGQYSSGTDNKYLYNGEEHTYQRDGEKQDVVIKTYNAIYPCPSGALTITTLTFSYKSSGKVFGTISY